MRQNERKRAPIMVGPMIAIGGRDALQWAVKSFDKYKGSDRSTDKRTAPLRIYTLDEKEANHTNHPLRPPRLLRTLTKTVQ